MKKFIILTLSFLLICPPAHAWWFSKKKKQDIQTEQLPEPAVAAEDAVDWTALKNVEEVMDTMVPRFNANKINNIHPGMTHAEIETILGDSALIGYQDIRKDGSYQSILLKNPYRTELLKGLGKSYEVFFYVSNVTAFDGKISDDELTPVIFENSRLIGKDWVFYQKLKKQLEGTGD